ncbi:MAG: glutamine synthetase, partial [Chloroflexi bacterium]|nr:glutamine synthetase [Chloroflexota bacterium]
PLDMTPAERRANGVNELPTSLDGALRLASESELLRKALGSTVMDSFIRNKSLEWADYSQTVTDFEKSRYLRML